MDTLGKIFHSQLQLEENASIQFSHSSYSTSFAPPYCKTEVDNMTERGTADPRDLTSSIFLLTPFLIFFDLIVISGNVFVIAAILNNDKLRSSVTNTFVASLAVADLLLGLTVLPFSIATEVLSYWPFGEAWCTVWLVLDVWLCTSSILNLCAISLDRYLAISCSFRYPRLMSPLRAKLLVAVVWMSAFLICFPPLIGWRETSSEISQDNLENSNNFDESVSARASMTDQPDDIISFSLEDPVRFVLEAATQFNRNNVPAPPPPPPPECRLNSASGYIIYSASGSFWIPMIVMVSFYWRIYVTAKRATAELRRGVIIRNIGKQQNHPNPLMRNRSIVTLRVHRGGGGGSLTASVQGGRPPIGTSLRQTSWESPHQNGSNCDDCAATVVKTARFGRLLQTSCNDMGSNQMDCGTVRCGPGHTTTPTDAFENKGSVATSKQKKHTWKTRSGESAGGREMERSSSRSRLSRLKKEKKAAKTIGIIVGCFIASWMPFFTVYLLGSFCPGCTPDKLFTTFFWLGYFNSAINPFIYGLCSNDFRNAFRRLLRIETCCGKRPAPRSD